MVLNMVQSIELIQDYLKGEKRVKRNKKGEDDFSIKIFLIYF
jgi:hypothetical protein